MKRTFKACLIAGVVGVAVAACGGGDSSGSPWLTVGSDDATSVQTVALTASLSALPLAPLDEAERQSLAYMREEEKLAHDVYAQLDAQWGTALRVFGNIAASEATHTEAVRQLLLRYALPDPAADAAVGVFQNWDLQQLHALLLARGSVSLVDALTVGAAIEEVDMLDINQALSAVDNQDITWVYQHLLEGSRNHLRAFVSALAAQGVGYVPQYLAPTDYQAIVDAPMAR